jgi:predicted nuclease of predicted toxin-antitoxin system
MKFIVDVCLSQQVAQQLAAFGWEVRHWSEVGDPKAKDRTIMEWAIAHAHIVIMADTDFGHLLALLKGREPSTIILRTAVHSAKVVVPLLLDAVERSREELMDGCLLSVDEVRVRMRRLHIS